jgi:hypothetical protein
MRWKGAVKKRARLKNKLVGKSRTKRDKTTVVPAIDSRDRP